MSYGNELIQVAAVALAAWQDKYSGSTKLDTTGTNILAELIHRVVIERELQEEKWGTRRGVLPAQWLAILVEEVGEVARAILEKDFT